MVRRVKGGDRWRGKSQCGADNTLLIGAESQCIQRRSYVRCYLSFVIDSGTATGDAHKLERLKRQMEAYAEECGATIVSGWGRKKLSKGGWCLKLHVEVNSKGRDAMLSGRFQNDICNSSIES